MSCVTTIISQLLAAQPQQGKTKQNKKYMLLEQSTGEGGRQEGLCPAGSKATGRGRVGGEGLRHRELRDVNQLAGKRQQRRTAGVQQLLSAFTCRA